LGEWIAVFGVVIGIGGLFWLCGHLIKEVQAGDRRYGNPDDWNSPAGHHE